MEINDNKEEKIDYKCEFCNKDFISKYSLSKHQKTAKYCLEKQGLDSGFKCDSCDKTFGSKERLNEHILTLTCKKIREKYTVDIKEQYEDIKKENEGYKSKLLERDIQIIERDIQIKELRNMLENANKTIAEIAKQPKTITKNTNTTNIKGNQNIKNVLTDNKTYEENTSRDRIISVAKENDMEQYFWKGQKGVAQFCVEHVVKTYDGKMIICCTDPTRYRFKNIDEQNKIREDIDARNFTDKVAGPIKDVVEEVYNNIQKDIEDRIINKDDEYDSNFLSTKRTLAHEKYFQIKNIDDNENNIEYKKELSNLVNI